MASIGMLTALLVTILVTADTVSTFPSVLDLDKHDDIIDQMLSSDSEHSEMSLSKPQHETIDEYNDVTDYDKTESEGPYREVGLCVEKQYCINRDGSGIVQPRKKTRTCPRSKMFCPLTELADHYSRCGISRPNLIHHRIHSTQFNTVSSFAEWPWVAQIIRKKGQHERYECSAVLIDRQHLLTVAHCIDHIDESFTIVRVGEHNVLKDNEPLPSRDYQIAIIEMHPHYTSSNMQNDLAIVRLTSPVELADNVLPICMPNPIDGRKKEVEGRRCVVTGWGKNVGGFYSAMLKKISLPLIGHKRCQSMLRKTKLGRHFELHDGFICAGGETGNDACVGDGGAPLMCQKDDGTFELIGLVSWGVDCGKKNVPGVYIDVAEYLQFINNSITFLRKDIDDNDDDRDSETQTDSFAQHFLSILN